MNMWEAMVEIWSLGIFAIIILGGFFGTIYVILSYNLSWWLLLPALMLFGSVSFKTNTHLKPQECECQEEQESTEESSSQTSPSASTKATGGLMNYSQNILNKTQGLKR